jgi:hypothetical protein
MPTDPTDFRPPRSTKIWTPRRPTSWPLLEPPPTIPANQCELPLSALARSVEPAVAEEAQLAANSLTAALIEVLAGRRAPQQLQDWVSTELFELITRLCRNRRGNGLRLRSLRIQSHHHGVIEVAAHLTQCGFSRAAAVQLSRRSQGWLITGLTIALRPDVVNHAGPSR